LVARGFDAPALAQDHDIIGESWEALAGKRKRQLAGSGGDGLRGGDGPGLRGENVACRGLVPHFGVQVGPQ